MIDNGRRWSQHPRILSFLAPHVLFYIRLTHSLHSLVRVSRRGTDGPIFRNMNHQWLPFKQFQVLLTPSSGSFSSFPHGTCSLSVSRSYLALDGTYHPVIRAAIPNNSTLGVQVRVAPLTGKCWRGFHSLWRCVPAYLAHRVENKHENPWTTILPKKKRDLNHELVLVHSPLLKES